MLCGMLMSARQEARGTIAPAIKNGLGVAKGFLELSKVDHDFTIYGRRNFGLNNDLRANFETAVHAISKKREDAHRSDRPASKSVRTHDEKGRGTHLLKRESIDEERVRDDSDRSTGPAQDMSCR